MDEFQRYSSLHFHFLGGPPPRLLERAIATRDGAPFAVLDMGCGDGGLMFALKRQGLLGGAAVVAGVDLSPRRAALFALTMEDAVGVVSDACHVPELRDQSFDVVVCSQLIEHVAQDGALLEEVRRVLKADGMAYISSVIKSWYGFWAYRNGSGFLLDPTHVREYRSRDQFLALLAGSGLEPLEWATVGVRYPVLDLAVRAAAACGLAAPEQCRDIYVRRPRLEALRRVRVPAVGYFTVEALCRRKG